MMLIFWESLLGAVAITALLVHFAVLTNTTWFAKFMNGKTAAIESSINIG